MTNTAQKIEAQGHTPEDGQYSHCTNAELSEFERKLTGALNDAADKGEQSRWEWILDCLNLIELEKCRRSSRGNSNFISLAARQIGGAL